MSWSEADGTVRIFKNRSVEKTFVVQILRGLHVVSTHEKFHAVANRSIRRRLCSQKEDWRHSALDNSVHRLEQRRYIPKEGNADNVRDRNASVDQFG